MSEQQKVAHTGGSENSGKKSNRDLTNKLTHKEQKERERNRFLVKREMKQMETEPISFEVFQKSDYEKRQLKKIKQEHKQAILAAGKDPKKDLNP